LYDCHCQPHGCEVAFDYDEIEKILDVAEGEGVDEEGDEPLKDPQLIGQVGTL
jgi:hypothetical protein